MPRIFAHLLTYRVKRIKHAIYINKNFMFSFDIIMLLEKCSYIFDLDLFDKNYPDCIHNTQKSVFFLFVFFFRTKIFLSLTFSIYHILTCFSDILCIPLFFVLFVISLVPKVAHAKQVQVFSFYRLFDTKFS